MAWTLVRYPHSPTFSSQISVYVLYKRFHHSLIQPFIQFVCLWVICTCYAMLNSCKQEQFLVKRINELTTVVWNACFEAAKPSDQGQNKLCHTFGTFWWKCVSFWPLRKIVGTCYKIPLGSQNHLLKKKHHAYIMLTCCCCMSASMVCQYQYQLSTILELSGAGIGYSSAEALINFLFVGKHHTFLTCSFASFVMSCQ